MSAASKYNRIAPVYELLDLPLEFFFFRKWRKEALSGLSGKVLEIGVGSGRNLKYYQAGCSVTGIDASEGMLEKARQKTRGVKNVNLFLMDAEHLEFPDNSFDYIIATFVLCTIPDPVIALKEMRRVLKPSGELIALEHMHSSNPVISLFEHMIDPFLFFLLGDHTTRHTVKNIQEAGFTILEAKKLAFKDIFRKIRAKP
ncbi:class I SAM-dependent methyltransferase [Methanosarcina mazei]|jgi:demethylmenaquinone methyltransferase/2-methoxy-6-polyprenyl-1,4-benzoquinol methylase|uniref:Class I SAM-dependent methyltransferase n=4 Tax=Methanosarcina mazei TaxID=2209 RepID=A0A0F8PU08_METMZ|nr:class I SAM-dependent methyltransferase [Methanosarcina mazei]UWJ24390.1 Phosphatidylethanolamine N-methyltransferase [Methanosarcina mazei TMA]AKB40968.1 Phosphatidylethanolamine N-methyltransferase [Methanosarcina mazei WWM610]AKB62251.1 Phosphatidylethanolamine N-methyltransferase [Methanosarcina mazei SarPi]KKG01300.1 methyltransferase type 11 [Methanosarcina mazei]KKG02782.1 methyltransferase type 11 [Methanosarcina mazei]